jgi:soluble lytic murein transglycosylase
MKFCFLFAAATLLQAASPVEPLARAYRESPSAVNRAALERFADQHPRDADGALALLAIAGADVEAQRNSQAREILRKLTSARLPKISDHLAFVAVSAAFGMENDAAAIEAAGPVFEQSTPKSPLVARTAALVGKAAIRAGQPQKALEVLKARYADLTQPSGDLLLAEAFEKAGDLLSASNYYQRVWLGYPQSKEAVDADLALVRLKSAMGGSYPPPMPAATLQRAAKLIELNQFARAKRDLEGVLPSLTGAERDLARVRILACDSNAAGLRALDVEDPAASAERWRHVVSISRRMDRDGEVNAALDELQRKHPSSPQRLEALLVAGQHFFFKLNAERYYAVYQQCSMSFPTDPNAALCHWRAALSSYVRGREDSEKMLMDHVRYFPGDEHTPASLYYLGRLAESKKDLGGARAYYAEIESAYPNFYYTLLARDRLRGEVTKATPAAAAVAFLQGIQFPQRKRIEDFTPTPATNVRLERSRLLTAAALDTQSDLELRFGGKTDAQGHVVAVELAANATRRGNPEQGVRWVKAMAPQYLMMPLESAPREFWRYAYPLPWRKELEEYSRAQGLDPFLMAGLIRQESEFDARVISRSNAHGLSQIMPATGRELAQRLGIPGFSRTLLFNPAVNIRMGSFHLKNMFNYFGQKWEEAIASYNAGMGRVGGWLKNSPQQYREPAEWVETIPIDETRGYVQSVLRNADFYRRLYRDAPDEFTPVASKFAALPQAVAPPQAAAKKKAAVPAARRRAAVAKKR